MATVIILIDNVVCLQEYGIEAYYGPLQIAYRESITSTATETASLVRKIGNTDHSAVVSLTVKPSSDTTWKRESTKRPKFDIIPSEESSLAEKHMPRHHVIAVENGITSGLSKGICSASYNTCSEYHLQCYTFYICLVASFP